MRRLCTAALALVFVVACTVEDAIPRRSDAGAAADSGPGSDASQGGSAGVAGDSGSQVGGSAGDSSTGDADLQDSSDGEAGSDSTAGSGGAAGTDGSTDTDADAAGCASGEVECSVPGAPSCWGAGTDCSTLTECKGNWAACAQDFTPYCGDVRGFACCPGMLPVFCDVSGPPLACWDQGIDCATITDCSGEWFACPAGQKYVCGQGCKGN